jgi:hypothetical protein
MAEVEQDGGGLQSEDELVVDGDLGAPVKPPAEW